MPEDRPVKSAEISVFSHATEDEAKVKKAIMNLVPNIEIEIEESKLSGHFEDPILLFTSKIEHRKDASELLALIYKGFSCFYR
jgi:RNA binding exosome subunit